MGRLAVAMEQGHRQLPRSIGQGLADPLLQRPIQHKGAHLLAIGSETPLHLHHPHIQGLGALDAQGEEIGPVLVADGQQIPQAPIQQQEHWGAGLLQQGIGGHGGAQPHLLHQRRRQRPIGVHPQQLPNGRHSRIARPLGLHGEHLAHLQGAPGGTGHHIGEGAAPIDPEAPAPVGTQGGQGISVRAQTGSVALPHSPAEPAR